MARQFDIVENLNPTRRGYYPFLVILQHDRITSLGSMIAAPLVEPTATAGRSRLHPLIAVNGRSYIAIVEQLAAVQSGVLGRVVGSAEAARYEIVAALDLLFTGI